MWHPP